MAGNSQPIYSAVGRTQFSQLAAANNTANLSTGAALVFTPGANGSILTEVRVKILPGVSLGTTSVFRLWLATNTGALSTTTNNMLISEIIASGATYNNFTMSEMIIPFSRNGLLIPPTIGGNACAIYATLGSYTTGTLMITGIGGDF